MGGGLVPPPRTASSAGVELVGVPRPPPSVRPVLLLVAALAAVAAGLVARTRGRSPWLYALGGLTVTLLLLRVVMIASTG